MIKKAKQNSAHIEKFNGLIQKYKKQERMKEQQGLVNYLTNIILRPHRQVYSIQKLGPSKIVVKSHERSLSLLESMSQNQKNLPKQIQKNYYEMIDVSRREVTIRNEGKCIQASIYEPQLTKEQKTCSQNALDADKVVNNNGKSFFALQSKQKHAFSYENCVIFLHANSGSRIQGIEYTKYILQYRTLCVSFDYTGSGISQGQYTTMGVKESKDLSAVIQYVAERYGVKKFGLWGRSMGAVTGIYYLLTKYNEDFKRIRVTSCVIDSPFSDLQKLILQIASKRSSLPRFIFQPFMNVIEKDIIGKIGINIFSQLNLIQKIKNLTPQQTKLLNSVSFLGLASKDDKMISHQHCQELSQLLISRDVSNSELLDDRNKISNNVSDKHLMMLVEFKKEINTKGDFIEIQGDHNRPRTNEVKEKISFFIMDNFISYKDHFITMHSSPNHNSNNQPQKSLHFSKTGTSIKTKLAFTKALQTNGIKSRKDYQQIKETIPSQLKTEESISGQNYNLINLKEIKAKQQAKQSLSREKQSVRNSLNKNFFFRDRKPQNSSLQNGNKGLNIVSKEFNKQRIKKHEEKQNKPKTVLDIMKSSTNQQNESRQRLSAISTFSSFINKPKNVQTTPKYKNQNMSLEYLSSQQISSHDDSVNNSLTKENSTIGDQRQEQIIVSALNFSENSISSDLQYPNLTQRLPRPDKYFESLPSERYNRNVQSQSYVYQTKLHQSPGVNTTPFNLSIDNASNISIEMQNSIKNSMNNSHKEESFRKKQPSQILNATDYSFKKQTPKTPQVKISISEFRNKHQDESNNKSANKKHPIVIKKENSFAEANLSTHWSLNMREKKEQKPVCFDEKVSSKQEFQFIKKREPVKTNSIYNSDISRQESTEFAQQSICYNQSTNYKTSLTNQIHLPTKHPNFSNSFTQNSQISMKQMINNGQKGMSQSSTFNYSYGGGSNVNNNGAFHNQNNGRYPNQYLQYPYPQYQNFNGYYLVQCHQKNQNRNAYHSTNGLVNGKIKNMKTSQDQYHHEISYPSYNNDQILQINQPTIQFYSKTTSQSATYGMNQTPNPFYSTHNSNQPPKQPIEYKKKITRLLD